MEQSSATIRTCAKISLKMIPFQQESNLHSLTLWMLATDFERHSSPDSLLLEILHSGQPPQYNAYTVLKHSLNSSATVSTWLSHVILYVWYNYFCLYDVLEKWYSACFSLIYVILKWRWQTMKCKNLHNVII